MKRRVYYVILAVILTAAVFLIPILNSGKTEEKDKTQNVTRVSSILNRNPKDEKDTPSKVSIPKSDTVVTFIVTVKGDPLGEVVRKNKTKYKNVYELINSDECRKYTDPVKKTQAVVKATIEKIISGADMSNSYTYNTVLNGFTVKAPYSSLEKIRKISNVVSVSPVFSSEILISENEPESDETIFDDTVSDTWDGYDDLSEESGEPDNDKSPSEENSPDEDISDDNNDNEEESESDLPVYQKMTGMDSVEKAGFTGGGRAIAVIDNSFDCSDPVFSESPSVRKYSQEDIRIIQEKTLADAGRKAASYYSDKIPFVFDYSDGDNNVISSHSDHGTLCAAVAAGCNLDEADGYKGMAYDAQLVLMKVCKNGFDSADDDAMLAALDDAAKLSPDVLNISMGVYGTATNYGIFDNAYQIISDTGTLIVSAAGNGAENVIKHNDDGIISDYTDYGTLTYPAYSGNVFSAASSDTESSIYDYAESDTSEKIPYCAVVSKDEDSPSFSWEMDGTGYVYIDGYGTKDDYKETDVKDRIAVVDRGEISVQDKISYAFISGAAGIIIISDEPLYIHLSADMTAIPAAVAGPDSAHFFRDHPEGTFTFHEDGTFVSSTSGEPSVFSSYGVTSDLRLKPDISAVGTDISVPLEKGTEKLTGTSVSSAITAGAAAVMSQYTDTSYDYISDDDKNTVIKALMMNTAEPSLYGEDLYFTPRRQGAGNIRLDRAVTCDAYITDQDGNAAVSMGDSEDGNFEISIKLHNISDEPCTYKPELKLQSDRHNKKGSVVYNTLTPENIIEKASVSFYDDEGKETEKVELEAGEEKTLVCNISLSSELVLYYQKYAPNGTHIDGYIFLEAEKDGVSLSLPFCGYCGNWEDAEIFDVSAYQSIKSSAVGENSLYACMVDNNGYLSAELGKNLFTGKADNEKISIGRNTIKNIYDINSNSVPFIIPNFYLLRNAADFTVMVRDAAGNTLFSYDLGTISSYARGNEPFADLISTFNTDDLSNFFADLEEGEYSFDINAVTVPYSGKEGVLKTVSYKFTVDNTVPLVPETEVYSENGHCYLRISAEDKNGISGFILYTAVVSNNTVSYGDRLDELKEGGYIPADSYSLVSSTFSGSSTEFVYDITELYRSLVGLREFAEDEDISIPTAEKIFIKSADNAFNLSEPVQCSTIVPSVVKYTVKDNKGRPVEGAEITIDDQSISSDENGIIEFRDIVPDVYSAKITHIPDDYKTDRLYYLVDISNDKYLTGENIVMEYIGEEESYAEESTEASEAEEESASEEIDQPSFESDDSAFALVFIGTMLIITSVSLVLSRRKR